MNESRKSSYLDGTWYVMGDSKEDVAEDDTSSINVMRYAAYVNMKMKVG